MAHPEQTGPVSERFGGSDDEPPLDPAVERIRRKLVRLLLWSFGIMILGLIAVFSTIVYRINAPAAGEHPGANIPLVGQSGALAGEPLEADIDLPAGAQIVATSLDGPHMLIHLEIPAASAGGPDRQLIIVDIASGRIVRRFNLPPAAKK